MSCSRKQDLLLLSLLMVVLIAYTEGSSVNENDKGLKRQRAGKLFSFFQVVTFGNEPCIGSGKNGTCYTSDECTSKGGTNVGSCAQGFGVCCTFSIGCGARTTENCTYIESNNPTAGECRHTICPCNDNICQLRLDFDTFVIAGPSTNSNSEVQISSGAISKDAKTSTESSTASQCLTDVFSITNTAGTNPAPICGINSGQHMYADVDRSSGGDGCNELNFQLGANAIFTTIPRRQWSIKVSQIECDAPWRAPEGCTQYFFNDADVVQTYNYDGGQNLAFQQQTICVRRARGQCRICWTTINDSDFAVSGNKVSGFTMPSKCCGYSVQGKNSLGFDCVQIPVAMGFTKNALLGVSRFCGMGAGLVASSGTTAATICSRQTPFLITFFSDGFESTAGLEAVSKTEGFRLVYSQDSMNCQP